MIQSLYTTHPDLKDFSILIKVTECVEIKASLEEVKTSLVEENTEHAENTKTYQCRSRRIGCSGEILWHIEGC